MAKHEPIAYPPSWGAVADFEDGPSNRQQLRAQALQAAAVVMAATMPPRETLNHTVPVGSLADDTVSLAESFMTWIADGQR